MPAPQLVMPMAEWAPDMPAYKGGKSAKAFNVVPRTPISYGSIASPRVYSGALAARCQGAYFGLASDGTVNGFAGDQSNLYQLTQAGAGAWSQISKSANAYGVSADDLWRAALYGTRVIFTNIADPVQSFILGTSTQFSDLIVTANPPKAKHVAVVKSYLALAYTSDATYGVNPQRVWWSRNGDPTKFDDPGSQAQLAAQYETGYQDLLGDGGQITGIVGNLGNADGAVFQQHAVWRMMWAGAAAGVFQFFPAQGIRGCVAGGSLAQIGDRVIGLFEDGFYIFDGAQAMPIGVNRIDKTFYADLDQNYYGSITAAIDPINKLYLCLYPSNGSVSGYAHNGRSANMMIVWNWAINRWSEALPIPGGAEFLVRALSFGYTLDQLYTILGYEVDQIPFPLDSRIWSGGNLLLGIFDANHKLNYFTGTPLAATVDTAEIEPNPGGVFRVRNTRPIIDGSVTPSVSIGTRNRQVDTPVFTAPSALTSLGTAPVRALGRYLKAEVTVPASTAWTNLTGVELEGGPAGSRY